MDPSGPLDRHENRKAGGSTPPLATTNLTLADRDATVLISVV